MRNFTLVVLFGFLSFSNSLDAQQLSSKDKVVRIEVLPEYIVINCDNTVSFLTRSIRIEIFAKKSENEKTLKNLEELLEDSRHLKIGNHTDLLNAMSKLGFDYQNNFLQEPITSNTFGRIAFVFRKKQKYRDIE